MLTDEEKREAIEKVLTPFLGDPWTWGAFFDALAEEAIVIPVRVVHDIEYIEGNLGSVEHGTWLEFESETVFVSPRMVGKPGKAIAIIVPEEASDEA